MRKLILLSAIASFNTMATTGTGGTPSLPCYFDGVALHTTVPVTACIKGGGSPYQDGKEVAIINNKEDKKDTKLALIGYK